MKISLKKIICCTDFSEFANQAIPYALSLAREFQAHLYVCHIVDVPPAPLYGEAVVTPQELPDRMEAYATDELRALINDPQVSWEPVVSIGQAADEIRHIARREDADMVVAATHGRSGLRRLLLGSVTERLMRVLPCPLLTVPRPVRAITSKSAAPVRIRPDRIMVGLDFSEISDLAFDYGLSLAQEFQAELHLIHVVEPTQFRDFRRQESEGDGARQHTMRDRIMDQINNMIPGEARNWCRPEIAIAAGQPHDELIKYATIHGVDLIVLGVRGYGLMEEFFLGSTTDRVIRTAPCPVLSVRGDREEPYE